MDDLKILLKAHLQAHPSARLDDAVKFIYQNEFGGGHLIRDTGAALCRLREEMASCVPTDAPLFEEIGNGNVRVNLYPASGRISAETLFQIFRISSARLNGDTERFKEKLGLLCELGFDRSETEMYLARYAELGYPAVSHSEEYRTAYAPSYRVISEDFARFFDVFSAIDRMSRFAGPVIAAIDGMCASGKSTLAGLLREVYGANVFHADDYFLPMSMRTPERFRESGGNMERERLLSEVLLPLTTGASVKTRRFDCGTMALEPPVEHPARRVNIVEGAYSLHPDLREYYTLKIALKTSPETQLDRLNARDPSRLTDFTQKWIPLENAYFTACGVYECSDIVIET